MASTTALFTGLSGLNVHARRLDVIGNNIANANTTAFKSSRMMFQNMFSRDFSLGSAPGATSGGTNPGQIGLGVGIAGTQRNMGGGVISATGDRRDLAIDGAGFFMVRRGDQTLYTRDGSFRQDLEDNLVSISGDRVRGYGIDSNFNIVQGALSDINIPIGKMTIAEPTENVTMAGNLNTDGELPSRGTSIELLGSVTGGLTTMSTANPAPLAPNMLDASTLLTNIQDPEVTAGDAPLFEVGQVLDLSGAEKGGRTVPGAQLEITDTTTVQDVMDFLNQTMGIHDVGTANPDGTMPGVALDPLTGVITLTGNPGTANAIELDANSLRLMDADGALVRLPFVASQTAEADGESVRTTTIIYDSLGSPVEVDITMVLDQKTDGGTTWRYYVDSSDDSGDALNIATGSLDFDTFGRLTSTDDITVSLDRSGTGAASPLVFNLAFAGNAGRTTALSDEPSTIAAVFRDGVPTGTLENFDIGPDGTIFGGFSNGAVRTLGQVALTQFANDEGLVDIGGNYYDVGPNSGPPTVVNPGTLGAGLIVSGALELSNVDIGNEFIDMITTSTGYSANSRVIRTTDELLQQLLVIGR